MLVGELSGMTLDHARPPRSKKVCCKAGFFISTARPRKGMKFESSPPRSYNLIVRQEVKTLPLVVKPQTCRLGQKLTGLPSGAAFFFRLVTPPVEGFFSIAKRECLYRKKYDNMDEVK